jgi:DNA polymerase III sliding clamp (beta) subunit (PCNA family)
VKTVYARESLVKNLAKLLPAVADDKKLRIEVLANICFTGQEVYAWNDIIAIALPWPSDFQGAVPGKPLVEMLAASRAPNVALEPAGAVMAVRAGGMKATLNLMPASHFVFAWPKESEPPRIVLDIDKPLRDALDICLKAATPKVGGNPEVTGVTVITRKDRLLLYATDNTVMTAIAIAAPGTQPGTRFTLPGQFCEQLVGLAPPDAAVALAVGKAHVLCVIDELRLFGRLITANKPLPFEDIHQRLYPDGTAAELVDVPPLLERALERAQVVAASGALGSDTTVFSDLTIKAGMLTLATHARAGHIIDTVAVKGHADLEPVRISAKLVQQAVKAGFTHMVVRPSAVVLVADNITHLISCGGR